MYSQEKKTKYANWVSVFKNIDHMKFWQKAHHFSQTSGK